MGVMWGAGALLGPSLAGLALDATTHGLPIFVALACGGFTLFLLLWREPSSTAREPS